MTGRRLKITGRNKLRRSNKRFRLLRRTKPRTQRFEQLEQRQMRDAQSEIREKMHEIDIETILPLAREKCPDAKSKNIADNGPRFISRAFKKNSFLSLA